MKPLRPVEPAAWKTVCVRFGWAIGIRVWLGRTEYRYAGPDGTLYPIAWTRKAAFKMARQYKKKQRKFTAHVIPKYAPEDLMVNKRTEDNMLIGLKAFSSK